ncbi:MAG: sensor histidine kinase, partial [Pseudomonadota bacterium]
MKHEGAPEGAAVPADDTGKTPRAIERPERPRLGGLSGKLLLLTVVFVMLSEVFIYVPS